MSPILEAVTAINILMPMVQRELAGGAPVTANEVSAALAELGAALDELEAEIKKQGG